MQLTKWAVKLSLRDFQLGRNSCQPQATISVCRLISFGLLSCHISSLNISDGRKIQIYYVKNDMWEYGFSAIWWLKYNHYVKKIISLNGPIGSLKSLTQDPNAQFSCKETVGDLTATSCGSGRTGRATYLSLHLSLFLYGKLLPIHQTSLLNCSFSACCANCSLCKLHFNLLQSRWFSLNNLKEGFTELLHLVQLSHKLQVWGDLSSQPSSGQNWRIGQHSKRGVRLFLALIAYASVCIHDWLLVGEKPFCALLLAGSASIGKKKGTNQKLWLKSAESTHTADRVRKTLNSDDHLPWFCTLTRLQYLWTDSFSVGLSMLFMG